VQEAEDTWRNAAVKVASGIVGVLILVALIAVPMMLAHRSDHIPLCTYTRDDGTSYQDACPVGNGP
jgi:hypothetical protein